MRADLFSVVEQVLEISNEFIDGFKTVIEFKRFYENKKCHR